MLTPHIIYVDDGWANATRTPGRGAEGSAAGVASTAAEKAGGAANYAYGLATGDEELKQKGSEALWGKQ
jgi:hypothetical protein